MEEERAAMGSESPDVQDLKNELGELQKQVNQLQEQGAKRWEYNFFALSGGCVIILALSAFALWRFDDLFKEAPQLTAALGLAFGAIVGLIGTYFGIKESHEARREAHSLTHRALGALPTLPPKNLTSGDEDSPQCRQQG
jgi:hypothetical protein